MPFFSADDGIADDTFSHLIDAWVEQNLEILTDRQINRSVTALDSFREVCGDRFADASQLEKAIDRWTLHASKPQLKASKSILDDILAMWSSIEK